MKKGLEILGISIVDADVKDAVFLKGELRHRSGVPGLQSHQPFPRCKAVHRPNSMSGSQQGDTCVCFQHVTLFHQRGEGLCQAGLIFKIISDFVIIDIGVFSVKSVIVIGIVVEILSVQFVNHLVFLALNRRKGAF